jgi:hypothetical protein
MKDTKRFINRKFRRKDKQALRDTAETD